MNRLRRWGIAAGIGAAAVAVLARRRAGQPDATGGAKPGTNWTPVVRDEPSLRDARSML